MAFRRKSKNRAARPTRPARNLRFRINSPIRILYMILVLVVIAAIIVVVIVQGRGGMTVAENGVGSLFTPVQSAASGAARGIRGFFTNWRNYDALQEENRLLMRENEQLSMQVSGLTEAEEENTRLKSLLNAQSSYESLDPIYAKVIARSAGQWFTTFSINRGTSSGVSSGMAVANGDGLIGRVYEAGLNYAKVLTIIDPRSSLGCLVQRTRDNGILRGGISDSDDTAHCSVYYLPNVNNIVPGDVIVTSGTDEVYPKGIPIGSVTEISLSAGSEGNYAVIEPSVDFLHIEEVLVLRDVVESASDRTDTSRSQLLTPSPAPSPVPSSTPVGTQATPNPNATESTWSYPTSGPTPEADTVIESLPEDNWAEG